MSRTENSNVDSLDDRLEFRKGYILARQINRDDLCLDVVLSTYPRQTASAKASPVSFP